MCPRGKNELVVRIKLLDFSPESDSVVDLLCIKENPLKNVGFNTKIKIIHMHLQLNGFWLKKFNSKNIFHC